jgi:hypothetical protein
MNIILIGRWEIFIGYIQKVWEIWAIYRIYLILPPGGIVGEKPPTVGELGIYIYIIIITKIKL